MIVIVLAELRPCQSGLPRVASAVYARRMCTGPPKSVWSCASSTCSVTFGRQPRCRQPMYDRAGRPVGTPASVTAHATNILAPLTVQRQTSAMAHRLEHGRPPTTDVERTRSARGRLPCLAPTWLRANPATRRGARLMARRRPVCLAAGHARARTPRLSRRSLSELGTSIPAAGRCDSRG